ncbi:MAG: hypothetical protein PVH77_07810 [Phycisphaerales bacterium]|jgi:hypothetical protein
MQDAEQKNQEPNLKDLEIEAFNLYREGKKIFALEKLEQAIKLDQKWYHFFYKAKWLLDSNNLPDAVKVVEHGLNFDKSKEFYFRCLFADMFFRTAVVSGSNINGIDKSIVELDNSLREVGVAEYLLFKYYPHIDTRRHNIPYDLKELCPTFLNNQDLNIQVHSLRTRIEMVRQSLVLTKGIMEAEQRVKTSIQENRKRIESERIRTIELLGIFTAIFAFIFSGVQILSRLPLTEALTMQAGIGLMMIIFFLSLHLVIEPESRKRSLILLLLILIIILLGLPLYSKLVRKISQDLLQKDTHILKPEIQVNETTQRITEAKAEKEANK